MSFNKVFCIGMSKTGTTSLNWALNMLGVNTLHWLPDQRVIEQLEAGDLNLDVLRDHAGVTDVIPIRWYRELDRAYPGSKFILTVRDKEDWLDSIRDFWPLDDPSKRQSAHYYYRIAVFGCLDYRREHFSNVYDDHLRNVYAYFKDRPQDLLELNVCAGDGWEKLCPFLDLPAPAEPFPQLNVGPARGKEKTSPSLSSRSAPAEKAAPSKCVVLVPVQSHIEPACEAALVQLEKRGYEVRRVRGYAAIDQGRNQMASDALAQGFDETMWIDADVAFEPDAVDKLRSHNLPICGAIYPKKGMRALAVHALRGTDEFVFGKGGGLTEVQYAATGFLHVRREAYEKIQTDLALPACNQRFGSPMIPFFQPLVVPDDAGHWYLAEDFAFCERARQCGYPIMVDTTIRLRHIGAYAYSWEDAGMDIERYATFRYQLRG